MCSRLSLVFALAASAALCVPAALSQNDSAWSQKKSAWVLLSPAQRTQAADFAEDYKSYLNVARSALASTTEVLRRANAAGFVVFTKPEQVKPGARLIFPNRDRALILAVIGSDPIVTSARVVGTHHDSPHVELKGRPILSAPGDLTLFKTIYYGGIKKYQWANRPLALIGRIDTTDGRKIASHEGFPLQTQIRHPERSLRNEGSLFDGVLHLVPLWLPAFRAFLIY